ncbi:hypothetical protein LK533_12490 [Sphingomonas sp. PL-96]|uniref:hypothetical protein n=1 Tax=Sphingomonas sp. PL-96 TaxID=2887201 RepID=UPI001E2ECBAC|nr:hypothetical protein [Sphingomonas sp. PL-96]MCC2977490.1 hypothetical protein [Sphingomonas sp. PL-96]
MRATIFVTMLVMLAGCEQRAERRAEGEAVERAVHNSSLAATETPAPEPTPTPTPTPSVTPTPAATSAATADAWIGRWRGVEGLFLDIAADPERGPRHYTVAMQYTLDDKGSFDGVAEGDTIRFTRPDGAHTLRATDGDATGLKWLAGKKDCLTVSLGEGYCRD